MDIACLDAKDLLLVCFYDGFFDASMEFCYWPVVVVLGLISVSEVLWEA